MQVYKTDGSFWYETLPFVVDDGGRAAAGFKGRTGDCVTRAIAIATGIPYLEVYTALNELAERERPRGRAKRSNARTGVARATSDRYLERLGAVWVPTMKIGQGCKVHLRAGELPNGRLIVKCSKHLVAVIDGVIHDMFDPSRDGTRCVYGYSLVPPAVARRSTSGGCPDMGMPSGEAPRGS